MDNAIVLWTLATLSTPAGMVLSVRLWVEYTAKYVDRWSSGRIPTFLYALFTSYVVVYGTAVLSGTLGNGMAFVDALNGLLIAVAAGMLDVKKDGSPLANLVDTIKTGPVPQFTSSEEVTKAIKDAMAAAVESLKAVLSSVAPAPVPTPASVQPAPAPVLSTADPAPRAQPETPVPPTPAPPAAEGSAAVTGP